MKFSIYTLGCKVNTYESNVIIDALVKDNYEQVMDGASITIINTCTVTNTADNKSLKMIQQAIRKNPQAMVIVVGCLTQVGVDLVRNIPGVAIILGNYGKSKIQTYIEEYQTFGKQIIDIRKIEDIAFESMQLNHFNRTRAFVKIQDGCNNFCSYCIIPYTRGSVRSKKKEDVLNEVMALVHDGHKEIVLTGIHTGHYGSEFQDYNFADLLSDILKNPGVERLRISSIEMNEITEEVMALMKSSLVLVDHMHIPLQSGSDTILKAMNRKYLKAEFIDKIKEIKTIRKDMSITTDLIVGFPFEGEAEFEETIETIKTIGFSKIHVFPYSRRKGTPADLMEQIPDKIKKERVHIILDLSKKLELSYMEQFVGSEISFIPETYKDGFLIGHTGNYLLIKCPGSKDLLHQNMRVKITQICYPYCSAEPLI